MTRLPCSWPSSAENPASTPRQRSAGVAPSRKETPFSSFQAPRQLSGGERPRGGLSKLAGAKPPQFPLEAEQRPTYFWRAGAAGGVTTSLPARPRG
jgi:hypothetical protein